MSDTRDLVAIGKIIGVSGIDGEMKIAPMTHSIERFTPGLMVWIGPDDTTQDYGSINKVRMKGPHLLINMKEIPTRTEAERCVGHFLFVDADHRVQLPPRTWFISDIIGMTVNDEHGMTIGIITDVLRLPANHVYVVRQGEKEILIPAIPDVVLNVDLEGRTMVIHVLDGLLEL